MDHHVLFGELRSLLQEAPSETLWARLCDHLAYNARGAAHHVLLSPCAPQLEALDMRSASLSEDDLRALSSTTALANLRALNLSHALAPAAKHALAASPHLRPAIRHAYRA